MQSRRVSMVEAVANVGLGYLISVLATALVLPAFGHEVSGADALGISAAFAVISLLRSYALRRLFAAL